MFKKLLIATLMLSPLTGYTKLSEKTLAEANNRLQAFSKSFVGGKKITIVEPQNSKRYITIKKGSCDDYRKLYVHIIDYYENKTFGADIFLMADLGWMVENGAEKINCHIYNKKFSN